MTWSGLSTIIVGHGTSTLLCKAGKEIDSYDKVIRLKRCQQTLEHPEYYGKRTDVVCGSWTIATQLKGIGDAPEYWVFTDSRHENVTDRDVEVMRKYFEPYTFHVEPKLCHHWNQVYRDMREPYEGPLPCMTLTRTSDEKLGHNHMSAGLHALLYACSRRPRSVTLIGFDNVFNGSFDWSITRGPDWQHYPDHRWDIEKRLASQIATHYGVKLEYIMPLSQEAQEDDTTGHQLRA